MSASQKGNSRRSFVTKSVTGGLVAAASTVAASIATAPPVAMAAEEIKTADTGGVTVFKLKSGLQFIDLTEGTGVSPEYGQLVSIKYTAYMKLPNKKDKEKFDSDVFLLKHGNGRLIAGLDEGMHTMKVGGSRRIIIPPKLGFVDSGLGPVPQSPFSRLQLNKLLEEMIKVRGGNLIYDVEMVRVVSDEADQGYYDDSSLTEEQFNTLRDNIQGQARDSRGLPGLPTVAGDA
jgi:FKBP-type peptidyl-prolyl cis-trans isomerase